MGGALRTKREISMSWQGHEITIVKGASVMRVKGPGGGLAITDPANAIRDFKDDTMLAHDVEYRYIWISEADIA